MRLVKLKGFKVTKSKSGKTILEPIPCYGKDASARIAAKKKVRIARRAPG
jgi:hypothetical protein